MKKLLVIVVCIAAVVAPCSVDAKGVKIGYVDILKVFNQYTKTQDYEGILEEKKKVKEEETRLNEKKEEIIKMQDKLELLKEREQAQQKEKIRKAIVEYRNVETQILSDLKKESDERMKEILEDLNTAIEEHAKKHGFDMIVNKSAILFGADSIDVTGDIVKILNTKYQKKK